MEHIDANLQHHFNILHISTLLEQAVVAKVLLAISDSRIAVNCIFRKATNDCVADADPSASRTGLQS
jgi:hypothetical protein